MTKPPPTYLVLQCYGSEGIFLECAFALLSLCRIYSGGELDSLQIWLYTDKPEWFSRFKDCPLHLNYRKIDAATIQQWRGAIDFVHRIKIEVLLDFTKDHVGNVLYADTDIIFTHKIDKIWEDLTNGALYMHMMEGKISSGSNPLFRKLDRYLRSGKANGAIAGKPLYDFHMWNAGVLGFNTQSRHLLQQTLEFTDAEFPKFPKHIIEQFAFSVQFQITGQLKSALPYILHYWNMKEARELYASFFEYYRGRPWDDLVKYSGMIQMYDLVLQKIRFEYNRTASEKIINKKWKPEPCDWALLVQQF